MATYEIKFELLGAISRVRYRDEILVPGLMKIKGLRLLRVSPMHRTNTRGTIRTVRESLGLGSVGGFGGVSGNLGAQRYGYGREMPTPRGTLDSIALDWAEGGVKQYDAAMNTADMRYHVMMPVSELRNYTQDRYFRAPKDAFDGMYHNFIKNGATNPVYVAIGKNLNQDGMPSIKITGGEDLVWFALKSGLAELPVFLSYQRQV